MVTNKARELSNGNHKVSFSLKQARTDAELDTASDILAGIDLGAEEEEIDKENAENFDEKDSENEIVFAWIVVFVE